MESKTLDSTFKVQGPKSVEEKTKPASTMKKLELSAVNKNATKTQHCNYKNNTASSSQQINSVNIKSSSCTDLDKNTKLFFNEKGWPVKVMRLTEDSPPKAAKPWPTRSSTNVKKSPRKEKSLFTQNKVLPRSTRENKENKSASFLQKEMTNKTKHVSSSNKTEDVEKPADIPRFDLDVKSALNLLDETIDKFASENVSKDKKDDKNPSEVKESATNSKPKVAKRVLTKEKPIENMSVSSARSNKYDSKEMKKYIQAKRQERKQQMCQEVKKKQETIEMQRKNLEKLKEKAHQVLKKSSLKNIEESKPKWQGPLEEDSEISVPGIYIFDSKIPTAKRSKSSVKSDKSDLPNCQESLIKNKLKENDEVKLTNYPVIESELIKNTDKESISQMNSEYVNSKSTSKKLRLSSNSPGKEANISAVLAQAATNLLQVKSNQEIEEPLLRSSIERLSQVPELPNGWNLFQLTPTDLNIAPTFANNERRNVSQNIDASRILFPQTAPPSKDSNRNTHQPVLSRNLDKVEPKKTSTSDGPLSSLDVKHISLQDALKEVQVQISQKENSEPEWLKNLIKPDPFRMINMVQMKNMLSNPRRESSANEKRERLKQKVISRRSSTAPSEDETDAPSIESMEEDFKILPDPLRLSDMNIPKPRLKSVSSEESLVSSVQSSRPSKSPKKFTVSHLRKSSYSSFNSEIPPLILPDSVQHLKLQSTLSNSDFSSSVSYQQSSYVGSFQQPETEKTISASTSGGKRRRVSPVPLSSSSKTMSLDKPSTLQSLHSDKIHTEAVRASDQIEIGQVLSSAALRLQFHAELSRLDAFDESLAQVIAAEQLYHMAQGMNRLKHDEQTDTRQQPVTADQTTSQLRMTSPSCESDTSSRSKSEVISEQLLSVASEQVPNLVSEHLPSLLTVRTLDSVHSSLHSIQEALSVKDRKVEEMKEVVPKQGSPVSSVSSVRASLSPKNLHFLKVMIEDAEFQQKQHQLLYKTQEDMIHAQYKAAITELEFRYSTFKKDDEKEEALRKENKAKLKLQEQYLTAIANVKEAKECVLSNWSKRIESLKKQREHLKKTMKNKPGLKLKSTEASPKKLTPMRSASLTSVVETSSSSEDSVVQTFEDKKRTEVDKEKGKYSRRKLEKELLKKYQEEVRKMQEIEKEKLSLMSVSESRSRRDKSTSPLESVLEATNSDKRDVACSAEEDKNSLSLQNTSSLRSVEEARTTDVYNSESFESPESSETPRQPRLIHRPPLTSKPFIAARSNSKSKVLIKVPLSPRLQFRSKRRCSSGSDESVLLSQNETQSEQSDYEYEVRILALKEQKRQRSAELNRLHRELKRVQREQQKATEQALIKQIQVYDSYIAQTKKQLDDLSTSPTVKPQIKQPRVSDKFLPRTSDVSQKQAHESSRSEEQSKQVETVASDVDTTSLKSISEASSTETTIQSSCQAQVAEELSPQADVASETASKVESEILQNVETEESNSNGTESSIKSEISIKKSEVSPKNFNEESEEWIDAEEFFSQVDESKSATQSKSSKESVEENLQASEVISSPSGTIESESLSKTEVDSQEIKVQKNSSSEINEESVHSKVDSESRTPETVKEDKSAALSTVENQINSEQLDVGSIVSIISQAPSSTPKTPNSLENVQSEAPVSAKESTESVQSEEEADVSTSFATSSKSVISEVTSVINTQTNDDESISVDLTPQNQSEADDNNSVIVHYSDAEDDNVKSSDSDMIKVFVNKKEAKLDKSSATESTNAALNETYNILLNETYTVSKPLEDSGSKVADNETKAEEITDHILSNLLKECFDFEEKPEEEPGNLEALEGLDAVTEDPNLSVDDFTKSVLDKFLLDATDCILKINESRKITENGWRESSVIDELRDFDNSASNQLLEALALEKNSSSQKIAREDSKNDTNKSKNSSSSEVEGEVWVEEAVSLQAQREAEELRLKQLQIEQEIKQLEQAQENIPSYYYVREIPNKPPPPYTPPGHSSSKSKEAEDQVPSRRDTEALVTSAVQTLLATWRRGGDVSSVAPPDQFTSKHVPNPTYNKFLFDLVKQTFTDISVNKDNETHLPPWEQTGLKMKHLMLPKMSEESISNIVMKRIQVLFGYEPDSMKENMIIQWSRKKRDRVDELLVRESQEEEREWTDYSKCEVAVKNNVALSIVDSLIDDTTLALSCAFSKKLKYTQDTS